MGLISKKNEYTLEEKMNMARGVVDCAIPYVNDLLLALPQEMLKGQVESASTILFSYLCLEKAEDYDAAYEALPQAIYDVLVIKHTMNKDEAKEKDAIKNWLMIFSHTMNKAAKTEGNPLAGMDHFVNEQFKLEFNQTDLNDLRFTIDALIEGNDLQSLLKYSLPASQRREPDYKEFGFTKGGNHYEYFILMDLKSGEGGALYMVNSQEPYDRLTLGYFRNDAGKISYYEPTPEELKPLMNIFMMMGPQYFRQ